MRLSGDDEDEDEEEEETVNQSAGHDERER